MYAKGNEQVRVSKDKGEIRVRDECENMRVKIRGYM